MNKVILSGYIATDLELKHTQNSVAVCSFRLGVRRTKGEYDFYTIVCWKTNAEFLTQHFSKGDGIEVAGRLITRYWDDKTTGKKRSAVEITAENIDFGKSKGSPEAEQMTEPPKIDDDLPF